MILNLRRINRLVMAAVFDEATVLDYVENNLDLGVNIKIERQPLGGGLWGKVYKVKNSQYGPTVVKITTNWEEYDHWQYLKEEQDENQDPDSDFRRYFPLVYEVKQLPYHGENPEVDERLKAEDEEAIPFDLYAIIRENVTPWGNEVFPLEWESYLSEILIELEKISKIRFMDDLEPRNLGYRKGELLPDEPRADAIRLKLFLRGVSAPDLKRINNRIPVFLDPFA